jgi:DnaK suppressor protein
MTTKELTHFRTVLEARETELQELLRDREVIAVNLSADMLDQIQNAQDRDMAMGNLERASARLLEVRTALRRIQLGTFGICADETASGSALDYRMLGLPGGCGS